MVFPATAPYDRSLSEHPKTSQQPPESFRFLLAEYFPPPLLHKPGVPLKKERVERGSRTSLNALALAYRSAIIRGPALALFSESTDRETIFSPYMFFGLIVNRPAAFVFREMQCKNGGPRDSGLVEKIR